LEWGRCFGFMPICKASSRLKPKVCRRRSKAGSVVVAQSTWPAPTRFARTAGDGDVRVITWRQVGTGVSLGGKIPILASPRAYFRCG
jgi:hypothetical protein